MKYKTITLLILLLFLQSCTTFETSSKEIYSRSIKEAEKYCKTQINPPPLIFMKRDAFNRLAETLTELKDGVAAHIVFSDKSCIIIVIDEYKDTRYEKGIFDHELGHHIYHCVQELDGKDEVFARRYSEGF